jgi:hypothetical protein
MIVPDTIRLADPVKIAAINATLLGIWVAVAALRLSRGLDASREASKYEKSILSFVKDAEEVDLGLGVIPSGLIYSAPQDFRIRAEEFVNLIASRSETTSEAPSDDSTRFFQLMSAISNQYPFATRAVLDTGAVRYLRPPIPLFPRFDSVAIGQWASDVSWLERKLVTPIAIFPRRVRALTVPTVQTMDQLRQIFQGSTSVVSGSEDVRLDVEALLSRVGPGFGDVPGRLAKHLVELKEKSSEVKRLLIDIDYTKGGVPSRRSLVLLSLFTVFAFVSGVIYPLLVCSGVLPALACACQSSIVFSLITFLVPWCFYFLTALGILFSSFRRSRP